MSLIDEFAALIESYPANRWYREGHTALEAMQAEVESMADAIKLGLTILDELGDQYLRASQVGNAAIVSNVAAKMRRAIEARASLQGDGLPLRPD